MVYFADKLAYLPWNSVKLREWRVNNRLIMNEHLVGHSMADVCAELCRSLNDETIVVNPSELMFNALIDWGVDHPDEFTSMRILGDVTTLKQALSEFTIASRTADLVHEELLEVRTVESPPKSSIAVDGERMLAIIDVGTSAGALTTTDPTFVESIYSDCAGRFNDATAFSLRTPPLSRVEWSMIDRLGDDRWEDFVSLVDASAGNGNVDEVVISLLVAAKHGDLLYDISKWGEDIGLASKATFSRKKSQLEDAHLIETDSEPIEVGRPRLRLKLAEPALTLASPIEVVEETERRIA